MMGYTAAPQAGAMPNYQAYAQAMQQQQQQQAAQQQAALGGRAAWPQQGAPAAGAQAQMQQQQMMAQQMQMQQQQMQQQQMQQMQQQQMQGQQQQTADEGVGKENSIVVSGCVHQTVGSIVRGSFSLAGENHGKPTYRKDAQVNGLEVMIYFWDSRDGPNFCGWWFGPKIGGDQVWAYHPSSSATSPPRKGWKVPYDGPADESFVISGASGGQASPQQPHQQQQQLQQQQQQQQQQAYQAQLEMAQQAQQLAMQRQQEAMQRQQEEYKKRQAAENLKRMEEQQRVRGEMARRQAEEGRACMAIRNALQQLKAATIQQFDERHQMVENILAKELNACGTQKGRMQTESTQAIEAAKENLEKMKEAQRLSEEKAARLLQELETVVATAEAAATSLKEEAETMTEKLMNMKEADEVDELVKATLTAGQDARAKSKACTDFILNHGQDMKEPFSQATSNPENKQTLTRLLSRINECSRLVETTLAGTEVKKLKAVKMAAARKLLNAREAVFLQYDKDADGALNRREVLKYAKEEYSFAIPADVVERIFGTLAENGSKAISKSMFQKLKVAIGIARESAKDAQRRAKREEAEKELAGLRQELQEKVAAVEKALIEAEGLAAEAETKTTPLYLEARQQGSEAMVAASDTADGMVKAAKDAMAAAKAQTSEISEGVEPKLKDWIAIEVKKLEMRCTRSEVRLQRLSTVATKFRDEIKKRANEELDALEKRIIGMLKYHQRVKELSNEELYEAIDTDRAGNVDQGKLLAFCRSCEREPAKKAEGDAAAEAEAEVQEPPTQEEIARLFASLDDEDEGFLVKDKFISLIRVFMKVASDTVITSHLGIKEGKTIRRLEVGEVVEVLKGPVREQTASVLRVYAKEMRDGLAGWVTPEGNQGSVYLKEGGNLFKVVKETILTESFQLDSTKESSRKLKDTTRKLKVGEILEVREWPRKDEQVGLMRMKCKVRGDGSVGWVTTVSNAGTVFVEAA
mmetsp:Transcript_71828/g.155955  ORF Transcript_71828/g.155955 Transcript_71828/m.155955 type:complete len:981 (-) Transcript_71828:199-3141(-)